MVAALQTYKEQNYLVIDKKIMYKVEDSIMDVSYSYNTIYAYLEEFEKNKISETAFNDHMTISLCVAEFSYACLPQYYANVVGVTGTLTCLPVYIKAHLQSKYKIDEKQMFPIPSVYGSKTENRKIMDSIICDREDHFAEIVANLDQEFSKHRPILVFFRNKSELLEFYNSEVFHKYQKFTSYITEEHNEFERNERIKISSYKETITLLTNSFIRGTDFKLLNKKALEHGGFHAIVTYLIDTTADYIQATGRVARQGK
jgi:preprotein translocase subunit SecA